MFWVNISGGVQKMCDLVEEYIIHTAIASLNDAKVSKKKIIQIIVKRFAIAEEDAESYYNDFVK